MTTPGAAHLIADVVCLENMLERGKWTLPEVPFIQKNIRILSEAAQAGLQRVPADVQEKLRLIDPLLRARWDFTCDMWAIERWCEEPRFCRWEILAHRMELGPKLYEDLRRGDTWTDGKSTNDRIREMREEAERIRKSNEQKGNEKVLAAVDRMKDTKNFVEVEEAVARGEQVVARGETAKILETISERGKKLPVDRQKPAPYGRRRFKVVDRRRIKAC